MIKNRILAGAGYGTHITPLVAAVLATKGHVIEMGMGDYSTPLLHEIIGYQRLNAELIPRDPRRLFSFESDKQWLNNFIDLNCQWHTIQFVSSWDLVRIPSKHVSVIFIDHAPAERRKVDIKRCADSAEILVVHDTEKVNYYGYEPLLSSFRYRFDYERYQKKTTLLSNFMDVTKIL